MIKQLLSAGLLLLSFSVFSQAFNALYPFSMVTNSTGATDPTPSPTATGVSFSAFTAVGLSPNSSAGGRFSFTSWGSGQATDGVDTYSTMTGAIDLTKYYEVIITPTVGYGVTLTQITFDVRRSGTGIRNYAVRSSADSYGSNLPASVGTNTNLSVVGSNIFFWNFDNASTTVDQKGSTITLSGGSFTNFLNPLNFRFYAWNAEGNGGTFSIDTVRFIGTATLGAGIGEISHALNTAFKLYPNPSNDGLVYLEPKNINYFKVEVINVLGTVVASENKEAANTDKIKLNLNTLPAGTYFVKISSANKVYTERLFISK